MGVAGNYLDGFDVDVWTYGRSWLFTKPFQAIVRKVESYDCPGTVGYIDNLSLLVITRRRY